MIILKPNGGLCNRLRAIDSAVLLSREINQPLRILWTLSPELNCSFHSLLHPPENTTVVDVKEKRRPSPQALGKVYFLFDYIAARMHYQRVIFQSGMNRLCEKNYDFTQLSKYESTYITCCSRFYRVGRRFQQLRPTGLIKSTVDGLTVNYSPYMVGVHIRRTDHLIALSLSPEEGFIHAMDKEIEQCPEVKFFLASDCLEVMERFIKRYGNRIIWYLKEYGRNSNKGIQDAVVDLLCLSKTTKIIGSYGSSFSGTAAQLNDISAIYIKSGQTGEES